MAEAGLDFLLSLPSECLVHRRVPPWLARIRNLEGSVDCLRNDGQASRWGTRFKLWGG